MAFRGGQGFDPMARSNHVPPFLVETVYYTRRLEGFLSCTFHNPPLSGVTYWALDDNAWVGWLHLRSDGSSKIYLAFNGTAIKSGGGTDNPRCTNDDVEADAPSMTLDNEPSLGSGLYYSSMDELDTALQGVSGGSPVWTAYTVSNALDVAGTFGPALDGDINNVMSSANPWNFIGSDGAAYFSLNVFGNVNTGSWSPDPSGDTYADLTGADFDGSIILTDPTAGGGPLGDYIIGGAVSPYINSSANLPVGVGGAVPFSGMTGDLPHANGDWGSQFITRTTRWWVTREYIIVTYVNSSGSGPIVQSFTASEFSVPPGPIWVVVPCPALDLTTLCAYIDDTNNGALGLNGTRPTSASTQRERNGSNVAEVTTAAAHKLLTNDQVSLTGFGGTGYNLANVIVTVVDATHFTYPCTGSAEATTSDTGGTITPVPNGSTDTPNGIFAKLLQGWTIATWTTAGMPLHDAP